MTDQQVTSPVNLFSSPASSLTPAGSALDALGMNPAQSGAFSKELSHASQRAASSSEPSRWRQDASRDSEPRSSNRALESSRRSEPAEASQRSGASVDDARKSTASADSAERRTNDAGHRSDPAAPKEARSGADTSDGSTASTDALEKQSVANLASHADSPELDSRSLEEIQSEKLNTASNSRLLVEENADGIALTEDDKGSISVDEQLITGVSAQVENDEPLSAGDSDKLSSDNSQSSITAAVNGARPVADSVGSAAHETDNELEGVRNPGRASAPQLTMGEQLSPTELASRQGALVNMSGNRDRQSVGTLTSTIDSDQAVPEMPLSRPSTVVNTTVSVPGVQGRPVTVDPTLTLDTTATEGHLDSQGLPPIEKDGLVNTRQAVQSDMLLQANVQKDLLAQKIEQEGTAVNLMQSKQLAQQQVRSAALAPASADNVSQTSDNMFHSLPGGIVTAPILQRADAGNTQTINAPVNMPILQNDADKAMASNIRWMVSGGIKSAVVNVTPSGMGPISVSIGVENEQMNVSIVALQGSTREALDSMLPRLREQLAAQGHDSVKVDISDGRPEQSDRGYSQQFSGEQGDTESNSTDSYSDAAGIGNKDSDDEQSISLPENGALTLRNNGQIKSSYDVYV